MLIYVHLSTENAGNWKVSSCLGIDDKLYHSDATCDTVKKGHVFVAVYSIRVYAYEFERTAFAQESFEYCT
jgi:hypothetical protein